MRVINSVLDGLIGKSVFIYVDDVVVCSATFEQHLKDLQEVFSRLRKVGFKLKPKKCHFARRRVKYLGHIVSHGKGIFHLTGPPNVNLHLQN
jgi:hypothetical protein